MLVTLQQFGDLYVSKLRNVISFFEMFRNPARYSVFGNQSPNAIAFKHGKLRIVAPPYEAKRIRKTVVRLNAFNLPTKPNSDCLEPCNRIANSTELFDW